MQDRKTSTDTKDVIVNVLQAGEIMAGFILIGIMAIAAIRIIVGEE